MARIDRAAPRSGGPLPGSSFFLGFFAAGLWLACCAPDLATAVVTRQLSDSKDPLSVDIDEPSKPRPGLPAAGTLQDTTWIADWSFESGGLCTSTGWTKYDGRIRNDGSNYWVVDNRFDGQGGITGRAAMLSEQDLCWVRDGYGNAWDYSIVLKYKGSSATLSFQFLSDSEPGGDFVSVEADSAGASEARVNYTSNPGAEPEDYRVVLFVTDGTNLTGSVEGLALPDFGVPATVHEVYVRFESDEEAADQDGQYRSTIQAGVAVDSVRVTGGLAYSEDFEGALDPNVQLLNTAPATPFGEWARLFPHATDNDKCTENSTCSWLFTDPLRPAYWPDMAFGPGGAVVRNWLDDILVSPWASLASTPTARGTLLSFRIFPGNRFESGRIALGPRVRSRLKVENTDTSAPGDSIDCTTPWATPGFATLDEFTWETDVYDLAPLVLPAAYDIQVSFRVSDWQLLAGDGPPATLDTGPGPYLDRVRIGRRVLGGPVLSVGIDTRSQAQDCFPTVQNAISPGEHFSPDGGNRFGTCAFSSAADLGGARSPNLITGDSIHIVVVDARGAGGIASVRLYGAITNGPHQGKEPAPYTVGANGFFEVTADTVRGPAGYVLASNFFVDLDDTYFRGGDRLEYFWYATDAAGGGASSPAGITAANFPPVSPGAAAQATSGLYEVSFLPRIDWAIGYLGRIAADPHGDLDPTQAEIDSSFQRSCILYMNVLRPDRRGGDTNRTSFMHTLDVLGYRNYYDVYDHEGSGNVNNHLGGRANVAQASGYALIVQDTGRRASFALPDGTRPDNQKINQAQWYRDYLAQGLTGLAGTSALWILAENLAQERAANPLLSTDMGISLVGPNQGLAVNPEVLGLANYTFWNGCVGAFVGSRFALAGGCPVMANYDALGAAGTGTATHRYAYGTTTGAGAIVMNGSAALHWNTVFASFNWYDVVPAQGTFPAWPPPGVDLASRILACTLPLACLRSPNATDGGDPETAAPPIATALHPCVPNPFNPTTTLRFDLARRGAVRLEILDAAGRRVRTLVAGELAAGPHRLVWNGVAEGGERAASGVYFARLVAPDLTATRKLVLIR